MVSNEKKIVSWKKAVLIGMLALAGVAIVVRTVQSSSAIADSKVPVLATFDSPAAAADALVAAAQAHDLNSLSRILGPQTTASLLPGDKDQKKAAMEDFSSKYQHMNRWVEMSDGSCVLYIGADNFAFPVPLARNSSGKWYFDAVAAAEELRAREIGRNELLAIDACTALANAEELYFLNNGGSEYAQRIISSSGNQDGLYWPAPDAGTPSPLGHLSKFPKSSLASYPPNEPPVIDGYTLRILTAQGADADGGTQNYIVDGKMTGGFAVLAVPVKYGETGIMTFMISREGVVYERNLGPETATIASTIREYNPDDNWSPVD